jgi:tRNA A-37 threonylcarbamoyl transferase component Bud32
LYKNYALIINCCSNKLVKIIHAIHETGVHHHDIEGRNVTYDQNGEVWLIDFHLAMVIEKGTFCEDCADRMTLQYLLKDFESNQSSMK